MIHNERFKTIIFIISLLLLSCDKGERAKKISCEEFINGSHSVIAKYQKRRISPVINPRNKDEIAFVEFNSNGIASISLYNLKSGNETTILEKIIVFGQLVWSSDGFIYFINQDYSIIKLDPKSKNARSIFGNVGIISFLSISPNGQNLIFQLMSVPEIQSLIIDNNGNVIHENRIADSTGQSFIYIAGSWLSDSLILSLDTNEWISVINLNSNTSVPILELKTETYNFDKIFASESGEIAFIVESNIGIWKIDLIAKEFMLLDEMCLFSEYGLITNFSENEIIISQKDCFAFDHAEMNCSEDLFFMDIHTGLRRPVIN